MGAIKDFFKASWKIVYSPHDVLEKIFVAPMLL
jgi:hypothetical protein